MFNFFMWNWIAQMKTCGFLWFQQQQMTSWIKKDTWPQDAESVQAMYAFHITQLEAIPQHQYVLWEIGGGYRAPSPLHVSAEALASSRAVLWNENHWISRIASNLANFFIKKTHSLLVRQSKGIVILTTKLPLAKFWMFFYIWISS